MPSPLAAASRHAVALLLGGALLAAGCGTSPPSPAEPSAAAPDEAAVPMSQAAPDLPSVLLSGIPHVLQEPDFCGEAVTEMVLRARGVPLNQDAVFGLTAMDPARGMGATTRELSLALTRLGFDIGPVWGSARPAHASADMDGLFKALHSDLAAGVPSIVCTHFDERPDTTEHFRLVVGYDHTSDEVIYHDPAIPQGGYLRMARTRFLNLWPLKYRADAWTVIRMRLAGTPTAASAAAAVAAISPTVTPGFSPAAYAQHVLALRPMLRAGFTVVIEPPFVVVGDEAPERVKERAETTVRWAVSKLKKDFFTRDPDKILTVWLFGGKASYNEYNRKYFPDGPSTPYGFYSPSYRALVMNISTGGGTLVHEIVHPFMEANQPDCPSWLNEGLGSLFEQADERDGHIIGRTNWRLAGLQRAIKDRRVPTFNALLHTSRNDFYDDDPGTNYSQSRYLLHYLQEHGLLQRFWSDYQKDKARDPSGYTTLVRTVNETDMVAFQKRWETEVLELTFP